MGNKAILYCLSVIVASTFLFGCQSNMSISDNETQGRVARLEGKMVKLESAIQEKDITITDLKNQVSTLSSQNDSLRKEFNDYKTYSDNKFAINDIDIEKLMWNVWVSLNFAAVDAQYLSERYGDYSQFGAPRNPGTIIRPVLCNKLVNKIITSETTTFAGMH